MDIRKTGILGALLACAACGRTGETSLLVAPASADVVLGSTQRFRARVSGTFGDDVEWTLAGPGSVDAGGRYTAPMTGTGTGPQEALLTATSRVDPTLTATAFIRVIRPPVDPPHGPSTGGTTVTLTHASLVAGTQVFFGGTAVPVTLLSPGMAQVTAPAHAIGPVAIRIDEPGEEPLLWPAGFAYSASVVWLDGGGLVAPCADPAGIAVADVDGDGVPELAALCGGEVLLSRLGAEGVPGPLAEVIARPSDPAGGLLAGDLDGDGDEELVVLSAASVSILSATTTGFSFSTTPLSGAADAAVLADAGGDGILDLFHLDRGGARVYVRSGTGSGFGGQDMTCPVAPGTPVDLAVGPLAGGTAPWLAVTARSPRSLLSLAVAGCDETAVWASASLPNDPSDVRLADLDGDGTIDAVAGTPFGAYLLGGDGAGGFDPPLAYTVPDGDGWGRVEIADADGDGLPDLLTPGQLGELFAFRGRPDAVPEEAPGLLATGQFFAGARYAIRDMDGDGRPDLAVLPGESDAPVSRLALFRGDAAGSFGAPLLETGFAASPSSVADVLACAGPGGGFGVLFFSTGEAVLRINPLDPSPAASSFAIPPAATTSSACVDLGDSGGPAFAFVTSTGGGGTIGLGLPSAPPIIVTAGLPGDPRAITAADLDGDGAPDLAVALVSLVSSTAGAVAVLWNDGENGFSQPDLFAAGRRPATIAAADLDGDGLADLVSGESTEHTVVVLRSTGGRAFDPPRTIPLDGHAVSLAAGDIDRDGRIDLVALTRDFSVLGVRTVAADALLATGVLSYERRRFFRVVADAGDRPRVSVADLTGEGIPDLLISTLQSGYGVLGLSPGTDLGLFVPPEPLPDTPAAFLHSAADLDGDGRLDVLIADRLGGRFRVRRNLSR